MAQAGTATRFIAEIGTHRERVDLSNMLSGFTMSHAANSTTAPALSRGYEIAEPLQTRWSISGTGSGNLLLAPQLGLSDREVMVIYGTGVNSSTLPYGVQNGDPCFYGKSVMTAANTNAPYADLYTFDITFLGNGRLREGAVIRQNATAVGKGTQEGWLKIAPAAYQRFVGRKVQMFIWTDEMNGTYTLQTETDGGNIANLSITRANHNEQFAFSAFTANALIASPSSTTGGVRFRFRASGNNDNWQGIIGILEE